MSCKYPEYRINFTGKKEMDKLNKLTEKQLSARIVRPSESYKLNVLQFIFWLVIIQVSVAIMYVALTNW